jgi:hypothetical protein
MYYFSFVGVVFVICAGFLFVSWLICQTSKIPASNNDLRKLLFNYSVLFLSFTILLPVVYEFKPWLCPTQYKIIRDDSGKIIDLKKDATGFHWPLYSNSKFVCIPDQIRFGGNSIPYKIGGFDEKVVKVQYISTCDKSKELFIDSNGRFSKGVFYYFSADIHMCFRDWVHESFLEALNENLAKEEQSGKTRKLATTSDVFKFVYEVAEKWNSNNQYGCKIEVKNSQ